MSPRADGPPSAPGALSGVVDVVVPTVGRPELRRLLAALARQAPEGLESVVLVDDRPPAADATAGPAAGPVVDLGTLPAPLRGRTTILRGGGRGPAAARNAGWRMGRAPWVVFLDDDVVPPEGWGRALRDDLLAAEDDVAGVQAVIVVPLPTHRRPTDQERSDRGLQDARWATADMAYRRGALVAAAGFDERFPRAYREDADLALRLQRAGWRLERGRRICCHPTRDAPWTASVRRQRGNADDPLMRALHGRGWRAAAEAPPGRLPRHALVTGLGVLAPPLAVAGRRPAALAALAGWAAGTGELALARIAPGPRTPRELVTMLATSAAIPPAASWHRLRGLVRVARLADRRPQPTAGPPRTAAPPAAVLFDRDATLVVDVPYNGDPGLVEPMPGAREALDRLRATGIPVGVVSNQSGVARGFLSSAQVEAVNARVTELLGPFDDWRWCPHGPRDGCGCRKPRPGMVLAAAAALGVPVTRCAVVGDIGADVDAAVAAGARPILVPTPVTRPEEVAAAPEVAADLPAAVDRLLRHAGVAT